MPKNSKIVVVLWQFNQIVLPLFQKLFLIPCNAFVPETSCKIEENLTYKFRVFITINNPVKNHNPRELEVTPRLIAMLNVLPKTSKFIFTADYRSMQSTFVKLRKRVAHNLQNPRILSISFVSFRHWGGTTLAWMTNGNTLIVKEKLGHKNINSTMKYIGRIDWKKNRDFDVVTATTDEEIKSVGALGYQKYDERNVGGTHISYYRRPKMFGNVKV